LLKETDYPIAQVRTEMGYSLPEIDVVKYEAKLTKSLKDTGLSDKQIKELVDKETARLTESQVKKDLDRLKDAQAAGAIELANQRIQVKNVSEGTANRLAKMMDDAEAKIAQKQKEYEAHERDPENNPAPADEVLDEDMEDLMLNQRIQRLMGIEAKVDPALKLTPPLPPKPKTPSTVPPKPEIQSPPKVLRTPAPANDVQVVALQSKLMTRAKKAVSKGEVTPRVAEKLDLEKRSIWKDRAKIAAETGVVLSAVGGLAAYLWYILSNAFAQATVEHQKDLNGCFLIDKQRNTKTKVELLSCGHYAIGATIETCATQSWSPSTAVGTITECPDNTFNPCLQESKSRSQDQSVPLVPNVCDKYLYKSPAPASITGVTVVDACTLKETEACSVYCNTDNFKLPPYMELLCVSVDYPTAFASLVDKLGYDLTEVFPETAQSSSSASTSAVSKPLLIGAAIAGAIFLVLLMYKLLAK